MIELREITWDNFNECISLQITDEQEEKDYVPSNLYSLAQACISLLSGENPLTIFAIYDNKIMIGFAWIYYDNSWYEYDDEPCYVINRFMIDKNYQNKGFGKQAMAEILSYIKKYPHGEAKAVYLSYDRRNTAAIKMYQSVGFAETGETVREPPEVVAKFIL
jgi:diamine N-acetyltransferase